MNWSLKPILVSGFGLVVFFISAFMVIGRPNFAIFGFLTSTVCAIFGIVLLFQNKQTYEQKVFLKWFGINILVAIASLLLAAIFVIAALG